MVPPEVNTAIRSCGPAAWRIRFRPASTRVTNACQLCSPGVSWLPLSQRLVIRLNRRWNPAGFAAASRRISSACGSSSSIAGINALIVKDSTCELQEGENPDANVTLVMDSQTLKGIVSGETDGMQAFMGGKLRAEGDMMLAMKLSELFPV